jgi:hypothetical protein
VEDVKYHEPQKRKKRKKKNLFLYSGTFFYNLSIKALSLNNIINLPFLKPIGGLQKGKRTAKYFKCKRGKDFSPRAEEL